MTAPPLSDVTGPTGTCVHCHEPVYQLDDDSPAREHGPAGNWATLATGTSCPFRDDAGHAVYREDEPVGSVGGADISAGAQVGESWSRQFVRPLGYGQSAVIAVYFYVHNLRAAPVPGHPHRDTDTRQFVLVRATDFAVCRDIEGQAPREEFSKYTFVPVPDHNATEAAAKQASDQLDSSMFTWDGSWPIHPLQTT